MANAEQIRSWAGPAGESWVKEAENFQRMNKVFGEAALKLG